MKPFLRELFEYNHSANQTLAGAFLESSGEVSDKAIRLFSHLLNAHQIWNSRIDPAGASVGVWDVHPVSDFVEMDKANHERSLFILDRFDVSDTVDYTTSSGQPFTNSIRDILFHVINHSTYHRAQIAAEFRQSGLEPVPTDYIFYKR